MSPRRLEPCPVELRRVVATVRRRLENARANLEPFLSHDAQRVVLKGKNNRNRHHRENQGHRNSEPPGRTGNRTLRRSSLQPEEAPDTPGVPPRRYARAPSGQGREAQTHRCKDRNGTDRPEKEPRGIPEETQHRQSANERTDIAVLAECDHDPDHRHGTKPRQTGSH